MEILAPTVIDEKTTGLVPVETNKAALIFRQNEEDAKKIIDSIVEKIREDMESRSDSIATAKARKEMKSYKTKITRSRTFLESIGKEESAQYKKQAKAIDVVRNYSETKLKELEEEFIKPLAEFEQKEKDRIAMLEEKMAEIENHGKILDENGIPKPLSTIKISLAYLENMVFDDSWAEFKADAEGKSTLAKMALRAQVTQLEEAEQLRKEKEEAEAKKAEEDRIAREQQIAKDAAEKATKEAEARALKDKEDAERKIKEAEEKAIKDKEEADRKEAESKQKLKEAEERARLAEAEGKRKAEEKALADKRREEEAAIARSRDLTRKKTVNNEIMLAILNAMHAHDDSSKEVAKRIIVAMVKGEIPHVKVVY